MRVLYADEVRELLQQVDLTRALRDAFLEEAEGRVHVPPRVTADAQDGRGWLRMGPAFLNASGYMGFKSMNRRPDIGMRYLVMVYSIDSGAPVALMDANDLTTARTSAVNALGTHLLAREDSENLGLIGTGVQAQAVLRELLKLRTLKQVRVYSPREESRSRFAQEASSAHGIAVTPARDVKEALEDSDIVVLAYRASTDPVLTQELMRPGLHVTGLSSVRPEAREIDDAIWNSADVVIVDSPGSVFQSGDGRSIQEAGRRPEEFARLSDLLAGHVAGRTGPDQTTLFKSSGDSLQDVAAGVAVYEAAEQAGRGTDLGEFPAVKPYD